MAYLPERCLIDNPVSIAPGFVIEKNVYVLPGVPKIFQIMANEIIKSLDEGKDIIRRRYQQNYLKE